MAFFDRSGLVLITKSVSYEFGPCGIDIGTCGTYVGPSSNQDNFVILDHLPKAISSHPVHIDSSTTYLSIPPLLLSSFFDNSSLTPHPHPPKLPGCPTIHFLQSTSLRQHLLQTPLLGLQIRVSSNMLVVDEHVWHRALACDLGEGGLDRRSIVGFIELEELVFGAHVGQEGFGGFAVGAVGFAEDGDCVAVDDALGLGLCGGHGFGIANKAAEVSAEERRGGRICLGDVVKGLWYD